MNIMIKKPRNFLIATVLVFSTCTLTGSVYAQQSMDKDKGVNKPMSDKSKSSPKSGKNGEMILEVPMVVMVPIQVSNDLAMDKGCWVKLYDEKNYQGDSLLLVGPFGANWENKIRSLETGPKTNVTIFDNRNFRDEDKFIDRNIKIPDLSKKMGFFDNFRSMILNCI